MTEIRKVFRIFDQNVSLTMPIEKLPVALRALGRIPTEVQMQQILDEFGDSTLGKQRFIKSSIDQHRGNTYIMIQVDHPREQRDNNFSIVPFVISPEFHFNNI